MLNLAKRFVSHLPITWQQEIKRFHYRRQIRRGLFRTDEPEFDLLSALVVEGSTVIDVGANVGHYTKRLSDLVGATGRVFAVEPVPETFALLAANVAAFRHRNVTLLNVAASETSGIATMNVPHFATGLANWYEAAIGSNGNLRVGTMALDALALSVSLIKIDAEGHELQALTGLRATIERYRPTLIVETGDVGLAVDFIKSLGYGVRRLPLSPNLLCELLQNGRRT